MAKYPLIQLLVPYVAGILLANYFSISINGWFFGTQLIMLLSLLVFHIKNKWQLFLPLLYLLFLSIGYQSSIAKNDDLKQNHFSNFIDDNIKSPIECTLVDWPIETKKYFRVEVEVDKLYLIDKKLVGKLQLYLTKSNASSRLIKGDKISFTESIIKDEEGGYVVFLNEDWKKIPNNSLKHQLNSLNAKLLHRFSVLEKEERALVAGLLFGRREFLTWDMKGAYQKSGMMHLLAISGLHVGIVYLLLSSALSFLNTSLKKRRIKSMLIIACLIFYAAFTGFSPSVSRAVLMFSLFAFADLIGKPVNRFQVLLSAAFILLLVNPIILFSVGAQLSFTAVFFILWLYPKYKNRFEFKYWILNRLWQLILISLIAQMATAPFLAYYFGSISLVSTLSSIVGIPLVGVLIFSGALLLVISPIQLLFNGGLFLYKYMLKFMNATSQWFSELPFSQVEVSITGVQLVLVYFGMLFIFSKTIRARINSLASAQFYRKG